MLETSFRVQVTQGLLPETPNIAIKTSEPVHLPKMKIETESKASQAPTRQGFPDGQEQVIQHQSLPREHEPVITHEPTIKQEEVAEEDKFSINQKIKQDDEKHIESNPKIPTVIRFSIRMPSGDHRTYLLPPSTTILELKELIQETEYLLPKFQKLSLRGRLIVDNNRGKDLTLADYGVRYGETLTVSGTWLPE